MADDLRFLDAQHLTYQRFRGDWIAAERRMRGGPHVLEELARFEYEASGEGATKYTRRKATASYVNWPQIFATVIAGHLFAKAPTQDKGLNFGALAEHQRNLLLYNIDGVGNNGSQWNSWWKEQVKKSMATGHRWIFMDKPPLPAPRSLTMQDELDGMRPYLVGRSPIAVPMWHYTLGMLDFAVVRVPPLAPRLTNDTTTDNSGLDYLLLVRQGVDYLGPRFVEGGWWRYAPNKELRRIVVRTPTGTDTMDAHGTWLETKGEIPLWPLFYERDEDLSYESVGTGDGASLNGIPLMSRSGTFELGQLAVGHMNMQSAADSDAFDAAMSQLFLLGVSTSAHGEALNQIKGGSRIVGIPMDEATKERPDVYDGSTGAVTAAVFKERDSAKRQQARDLAAIEATSAPDSSGESKFAGWFESKVPRLVDLASNVEGAWTTAIHFLELGFGHQTPTGKATWTRDFNMKDVVESVRETFEVLTDAGVRVPDVTARIVARFLIERGVLPGATEDALGAILSAEKLDAEALYASLKEGAQAAADQAQRMRDLSAELFDGGGGTRRNGGAPNVEDDDDEPDDDTPPVRPPRSPQRQNA